MNANCFFFNKNIFKAGWIWNGCFCDENLRICVLFNWLWWWYLVFRQIM